MLQHVHALVCVHALHCHMTQNQNIKESRP